MTRSAALGALCATLLVALGACTPSGVGAEGARATGVAGGGDAAVAPAVPLSASAPPRLASDDAGAAAVDGAAPPSAGLSMFLEAAETDVERPHAASDPDAKQRYAEAGTALLALDKPLAWQWAPVTVGQVLALSDDPRAAAALAAWAARPTTRPRHRLYALHGMARRPRPAYVPALRAIALNASLAGEVFAVPGVGAFTETVGLLARAGLPVHALAVAASIPTDEARALLRDIAMDRSRSTPDARALAGLSCPRGRVELEAQALASLRIAALALLKDRALFSSVASDASEPALVRHWAGQMAKGPPAQPTPRVLAARASAGEFEMVYSPCR